MPTEARLSERPIHSKALLEPSACARSHSWHGRSSAMQPTSRRATIWLSSIESKRPFPRRECSIGHLCVPKTKSGDDFGFLRVKSTFGTRGSQVQILPLRPVIQLILNDFLKAVDSHISHRH